MSPSSDNGPTPPGESTGAAFPRLGPPPANWREALMALIAARVALIELESKEAALAAGRRTALIGAACACVFFMWALAITAAVSLISRAVGWPWDWVAAGLAALHLIVGILLAQSAKSAGNPAFPFTRAEFKKDREWIENFNKAKKSSD